MGSALRIFISYRRVDTRHVAGRLFDRLGGRFGTENVFMDVDSIGPGSDFSEAVIDAVGSCDVLLALIGPAWVDAVDERGKRRLHDPDDWVALEIVTALRLEVRVIPILVDGAAPPRSTELPDVLAVLATRQAVRLDHDTFGVGVTALMAALESNAAVAHRGQGRQGVRSVDDAPGEATSSRPGPGRVDPAWRSRLLADAERIAALIIDDASRARARSAVAKAVAVDSPDRAARLFAAAEDDTASVIGDSDQTEAVKELAAARAAVDPDAAERFAYSLSEVHGERSAALFGLVSTLAVTDPYRAERIADSIDSGHFRPLARRAVAVALARTDPDRAEWIADSETFAATKVAAVSVVSEVVFAVDPARGDRGFAYAESVARSITDEYFRAWALSDVAMALAGVDLGRAECLAESVTDPRWSAWALSAIATALSGTDPGRAVRIALSIKPQHAKAAALDGIATATAAFDLDRAERIAAMISDGETREVALSHVATAAAATDPARAERLARTLLNELHQVSALCGVATAAVTVPR